MKKIYITGSSRGLGKALAENYLSKGNHVVGLSRSCSIQHSNYKHCTIDLSNANSVADFIFDLNGDFSEGILINNAGSLGEVNYIGSLQSKQIAHHIQLNISSPMMLINQFASAKCTENLMRFVLNIGSGAGSKPLDGWGLYCSSKAAMEMFNKVYQKEIIQKRRNIFMRTIAPGIVDTAMQDEIRETDKSQFSSLNRFKEYKKNNELTNPAEVAERIISNFDFFYKNEQAIQSIRNY